MIIKPLGPQKPPAHAVNLHDKTRVQWEAEVFDDAAYFTVSRRTGPGTFATGEFPTFPAAIKNAHDDHRAMLYVVASNGRYFCIPRKEWEHYLGKWLEKHPA